MSGCSPLMRKYCCIIGVCDSVLILKSFYSTSGRLPDLLDPQLNFRSKPALVTGMRSLALAICVAASPVLAAAPKAAAAPAEYEAMDADRDGRVSASEHASAAKRM